MADEVDDNALQAIREGVANLDENAADFYYACAQHPGGLCVTGFSSYAEADAAASEHKRATGHSDCSASSGQCPF